MQIHNTNTQIHKYKYKNTVSVEFADTPNMCYIFDKVMARGPPKTMFLSVYNHLWEICLIKQAKITRFGRAEWKSVKNTICKNIAHVLPMCNFDQSCICVFRRVLVYLCICYLRVRHPGILFFWGPCTITFSNIKHMLGLSATLTKTVFVYFVFVCFCICLCVFAHQTPGNTVFEVLVPLPFQKYSTC